MKRFVIADTHFGHENIIKYCNRPFGSVDEMDKTLIANWNSIVSNDDIVWVLGDFALGSKDYIKSILSSLRGRKKLILGNHDNHNHNWYMNAGFEFVSPYPVVVDGFIVLSHAPMGFINENSPFWNIYGHVHNDIRYLDYTYAGACVSVERIEYKPIDIENVKRKMVEVRQNDIEKR